MYVYMYKPGQEFMSYVLLALDACLRPEARIGQASTVAYVACVQNVLFFNVKSN